MQDDAQPFPPSRANVHDQSDKPRRLLGELVQRMRPVLKSVAREHAQSVPASKEDESDIVQKSMVKAIERIDQFEGDTSGQWRAWLVAIVRNQAKDVRRYWSQGRRTYLHEQADSHVIGCLADVTTDSPSKTLQDSEHLQKLDEAIASLSIQEQQLVRWRMFHYLTYREIGARLKISEPTARRRSEAAIKALQTALGGEKTSDG